MRGLLFLGHTRFSVDAYGSAWFNATRTRPSGLSLFGSHEEYSRWLYDPERLGRRTQILLDWSLPQLELAVRSAQELGHGVRHVISYSPNLPEEYQQKLRGAEDRYDFLALHQVIGEVDGFVPPIEHINDFLDQYGAGQDQVFAAYRLDDDDVLSADYFELLAPYISPANLGFRVSLGLGASGLWRNSRLYVARETYYPKISMGMASICARTAEGELSIPQRHVDASKDNHDFADRGAPVITDCREPAFFRILHDTQSGVLHRTKHLNRHWYSDALSRIHHAPPANLSELAKKFPLLSSLVRTSHGEPQETRQFLDQDLVLEENRITFPATVEGPFVLEVEFSSEADAIQQDVALKWHIEADSDFDIHSQECVDRLTGTGVRYHRQHGYTTWLPGHRQYGAIRYAMVNTHPNTRVTGFTVLSRSKRQFRIRQIQLTEI